MPQEKLIARLNSFFQDQLESCRLCPRNCRVNRNKNQTGYCQAGKELRVYSWFRHFGEEPPLTGKGGSGTIFFSGCNLRCSYCQNYKFSQLNNGRLLSEADLALIMLKLEEDGAENINLVTPSHFLPQIIKSLAIARQQGLSLPLVYNTSGYEKTEIVAKIEPIISCWLIDFKYIEAEIGEKYSNSPKYPAYVKKALLYLSKAKKSQKRPNKPQIPPVIIRHLALPGHISQSVAILNWIKKKLPATPVSVMAQYQPYFRAKESEINRPLSASEYQKIKDTVESLELEGWLQEFQPQENLAGVYFSEEISGNNQDT